MKADTLTTVIKCLKNWDTADAADYAIRGGNGPLLNELVLSYGAPFDEAARIAAIAIILNVEVDWKTYDDWLIETNHLVDNDRSVGDEGS